MKSIMLKLFEQYNYIKIWENENRMFFINKDKNIVNYFILNFIDCTEISNEETLIRNELNKLEKEYIDEDNNIPGIKSSIIKSFENNEIVAQIDKNTSAIYLVKFSEINMLSQYRNLIYSIEESPNYFKRYILPYSEKQVEGLIDILIDYNDKNIVEILSELADEEENYYSLMNGKNYNSVYELVIRLFSKVPFLQYKFKATSNDISLGKMVADALDDNLSKYDKAIELKRVGIEDILVLEEFDITEKEIDLILSKLIEEAE